MPGREPTGRAANGSSSRPTRATATHIELPLAATIVTNVEVDHLDHHGTFDALVESFERYLAQIDGPKVLCADDAICRDMADRHGATTYGLAADADVRAVDVRSEHGAFRFTVERRAAGGGSSGSATSPCRCAACTTWSTRSVPSRWR